MKDWTPIRFVDYIDQQYESAKKRKQSRMSISWGFWSRNMNLVLRKKIEQGERTDPETTKFKYVFSYWIGRSQLLELHFKSKLFSKVKKKALTEELRQLKLVIEGKEEPEGFDSNFEALVMKHILKKK